MTSRPGTHAHNTRCPTTPERPVLVPETCLIHPGERWLDGGVQERTRSRGTSSLVAGEGVMAQIFTSWNPLTS